MKYKVDIPKDIQEEVIQIKKYIRGVLFAPDAAEKRVKEIISAMKSLSEFPERGFNADEKIGTTILDGQKTFGLSIIQGKYLLLYWIDEQNKRVKIIDLLPTRSDYAKLFL